MKKLFVLLAIATTTFFTSCTEETLVVEENFFLGQTFEVTTTLFFNSNTNIYETDFISIPSNVEVFESDAILAYRLEAVANGNDVWSQLPQNFFLSNGDIIQYVFNHTFFDVQVQLDGQYDPNTLPVDFTDNQTFRFVVVPSEFANANLTMEQAIETFNLQF